MPTGGDKVNHRLFRHCKNVRKEGSAIKFHVLGVGYSYDKYSLASAKWSEYDIEFDFADSWLHAVALLSLKDYVCIAICTDDIPQDGLNALRTVKSIPIVVVPPSYNEAQRYACVHFGAAQYLHSFHNPFEKDANPENSMRNFLKIPCEKRKSLTIITLKGLSVCLEHRTVEVMGTPVNLTNIEFDILSLLITRQRHVLTYGMLMDLIWNEPCDYYSKRTVVSHICNLRKKLKISPDVPNYIKNVHGTGYRFDVEGVYPYNDECERECPL